MNSLIPKLHNSSLGMRLGNGLKTQPGIVYMYQRVNFLNCSYGYTTHEYIVRVYHCPFLVNSFSTLCKNASLPVFALQFAYTEAERKPKNKNWGRPGNEATGMPQECLHKDG